MYRLSSNYTMPCACTTLGVIKRVTCFVRTHDSFQKMSPVARMTTMRTIAPPTAPPAIAPIFTVYTQ
jgi:hypothetical protein